MIVDKPICSRTGNLCYEFDNRVTQMQKNLLVYLWGSRYQLAVLDPLSGNQFAGDLVHFVATTAAGQPARGTTSKNFLSLDVTE